MLLCRFLHRARMNEQAPKGVLGENYADKRQSNKELGFRFRVRGEMVVDAVARYFPADSRDGLSLLDLGAAEGRTLCYMNERMHLKRGVGIEYNPALMARAGDLPDHVTLRQGDVTRMDDIPDASFDVVSALALLEHLPDPSQAVKEAFRVLRRGGLFVASSPVPFWDHWSVRLGLLAEDHHECDMHAAFFRSLFDGASGFELVEFRKFMWAPVGFLPYLGVVPEPKRALIWDRRIERMKLGNFLFVNQYAVGIKR